MSPTSTRLRFNAFLTSMFHIQEVLPKNLLYWTKRNNWSTQIRVFSAPSHLYQNSVLSENCIMHPVSISRAKYYTILYLWWLNIHLRFILYMFIYSFNIYVFFKSLTIAFKIYFIVMYLFINSTNVYGASTMYIAPCWVLGKYRDK